MTGRPYQTLEHVANGYKDIDIATGRAEWNCKPPAGIKTDEEGVCGERRWKSGWNYGYTRKGKETEHVDGTARSSPRHGS